MHHHQAHLTAKHDSQWNPSENLICYPSQADYKPRTKIKRQTLTIQRSKGHEWRQGVQKWQPETDSTNICWVHGESSLGRLDNTKWEVAATRNQSVTISIKGSFRKTKTLSIWWKAKGNNLLTTGRVWKCSGRAATHAEGDLIKDISWDW